MKVSEKSQGVRETTLDEASAKTSKHGIQLTWSGSGAGGKRECFGGTGRLEKESCGKEMAI